MQRDGEHWGNPRVVDGAPDIGFDERHLLICAGSWSNDSNSHNAAGFMHPVAAGGGSTRFLILPRNVTTSGGTIQVFGANRTLVVHQASLTPTGQSAGNGWINPPVSLNPPPASGLPLGYRSKYVAFGGPPAPWSFNLMNVGTTTYLPLGASTPAVVIFVLHALVDDECSQLPCTHDYFNMQGVLQETSSGTALLRSNMQGEYR